MNTTQGPLIVAHKKRITFDVDVPEESMIIDGDFVVVQTVKGKIVALVISDNPEADAALFAASHEMMEALIQTQEVQETISQAFEKIHAEAE